MAHTPKPTIMAVEQVGVGRRLLLANSTPAASNAETF